MYKKSKYTHNLNLSSEEKSDLNHTIQYSCILRNAKGIFMILMDTKFPDKRTTACSAFIFYWKKVCVNKWIKNNQEMTEIKFCWKNWATTQFKNVFMITIWQRELQDIRKYWATYFKVNGRTSLIMRSQG